MIMYGISFINKFYIKKLNFKKFSFYEIIKVKCNHFSP